MKIHTRKVWLLLAAFCAVGSAGAKTPAASAKVPLVLRAWPNRVSARVSAPVIVQVALENVTQEDALVRLWLTPVPFGPKTDLHCLMIRCRDRRTNREVRYTGPPPGRTVADAQGRELPAMVPSGCFVGTKIDLTKYCVLPPGNYAVTMQYDTRFVPSWVRRDTRAWHVATNKVQVGVHISAPGKPTPKTSRPHPPH